MLNKNITLEDEKLLYKKIEEMKKILFKWKTFDSFQ